MNPDISADENCNASDDKRTKKKSKTQKRSKESHKYRAEDTPSDSSREPSSEASGSEKKNYRRKVSAEIGQDLPILE